MTHLNTEHRILNTVSLVLFLLAGTARGTEYFVATNGLDSRDGTNGWGDALLTIGAAVAKATTANDIVTVSNGTYTISAQILITNAITVRSFGNGAYGGLANASNTVVQGSGVDTRIFSMTNAGTVLDGFTIRNGAGRGDGAANRYLGGANNWDGHGVYMMNGLVQNCIIKENGIVGNNSHLQGGGVFMDGGTVSNCTIQANLTGGGNSGGGGIYATGGQILFCRILGNSIAGSWDGGGGIYASSGSVLVRNCLIAANASAENGGGVYGGTVESCTIVSNSVSSGTGSGGGVYGSTVANSIVLKNRTGSGILSVADYAGSAFICSCSTPKPSGAGNADYAAFVNPGAGDYRLVACPAVDAGTNLAWMTGALDLAGNPRTNGVNNRVDMGAYELVPGALQCGLAADATSVVAPSNVVFTAYLAGTNRNVTSYTWDFGDGNTTNGATLSVVSNLYTADGLYTVKLTVSNDANESYTATNAGYLTVWSTTAYVWTNSPTPGAPYHTWANAARAIGDVVAAAPAGTLVIVTNGTYSISVQIIIDKALTVLSFGNGVYGGLANASNTVVQGPGGSANGPRIFQLSHTNASLDGLTIRNGCGRGDYGWNGNGVNMTGGLVRDCIIKDGSAGTVDASHLRGSGVYMTGGTVSNCAIQANRTGGGSSEGAGIYATGGQILHCRIVGNTGGNSGGGIYASSASVLIRNCLIVSNSASGYGGGVYGGTIESCTIVTNSATATGGGIYLGGTVSNSIVYFNRVGGVHSNLNTTAGLYYSCSINPGVTNNGCIMDNPLFAGDTNANYRLKADSPCIDAGKNQPWMTGAKDLAGGDRILRGTRGLIVDMGAYETYVPPKGTVLLMR